MRLLVVCLIVLSLLPTFNFASPSREKDKEPSNLSKEPIEVIGLLQVVGNEPFPRFALRDSQNLLYFLEVGPQDSLRQHIGSQIKVSGQLVRTPIILADRTRLADELSIVNFQWEP
ncbi:MAG: hypothetical protein SNJ78_11765, partial [Spirochaetales bacterium]